MKQRLACLNRNSFSFMPIPKKCKDAASLSSLTLNPTPTSGPTSITICGDPIVILGLWCSKLSLLEGVVSLSPPVLPFVFWGV